MNIKQYGPIVLMIIGMVLTTKTGAAQDRKWEDIDTTGYYKKQTVQREKYTLEFISIDPGLSEATKQRMIDAFFQVYPLQVKRFNPGSPRKVVFVIGKDYKGVAATVGAVIKFDQSYIRSYPNDIDVVTHELMHVVQSYGNSEVPGWVVEGIADYVRHIYGVGNEKAGWKLPDYRSGQKYTDAYQVTARFFTWLSVHVRKDIVDKVNHAARKNKYTPEIWVKLTGKSIDGLWSDYINAPSIISASAE